MNYAKIFECDIANGPGCRTSLFVSGCTHHCLECFNPETWDFGYGEPFTKEVEDWVVNSLKASYIDGLSLLGGEPMETVNQPVIRALLERVKEEVPKATVWLYSGYEFEELLDSGNGRCHSRDTLPILKMVDVLVDGEFHIQEKNIFLRFRGSSNQRIIDVKKSLETGTVILSEFMS